MNYLKRKRDRWNNASPKVKLLLLPFVLLLIPLFIVFGLILLCIFLLWMLITLIVTPLKLFGFNVEPFDIEGDFPFGLM